MRVLILEEKGQIVLLPDDEEEGEQLLRLGLDIIRAQHSDGNALLPATPVQALKRDCHMTSLRHLVLEPRPFDKLVNS